MMRALLPLLTMLAFPCLAGSHGASTGKPSAPGAGAWIGAWVNPTGDTSAGCQKEINQLPTFNAWLGGKVSILHCYIGFTDAFPETQARAIEANGSYPLIDWSCGSVSAIVAGTDDALITAMADGVKAHKLPVFLRWYWEMNVADSGHAVCLATDSPSNFILAWQRIWGIFQSEGATNAAFVWCPSTNASGLTYYPGDAYVDWLCTDNYDKTNGGSGAAAARFGPFVAQFAGTNKPIMIGETGAPNNVDQAAFLSGSQAYIAATPAIKAYVYFDAPADFDYTLTTGQSAFVSLVGANH